MYYMISRPTESMTFTEFTITNPIICTDLKFFYEASSLPSGSFIPSFMTFTRSTRTFTVYTTNAADVSSYQISVKAYANDRVFVAAQFMVYIVPFDAACSALTSTTLGGRNQFYRIGSGTKTFTFYPTILSNPLCYDKMTYIAYQAGTQDFALPNYVILT